MHWVVLSDPDTDKRRFISVGSYQGSIYLVLIRMSGVHISALVSVLLVLSIAAFDGARWHRLVGPLFVEVFVSVEPIVFVVATIVYME